MTNKLDVMTATIHTYTGVSASTVEQYSL